MNNLKELLKEEIMKPVRALWNVTKFSLGMTFLMLLRLVLWFFLFYLPISSLIASVLHGFTMWDFQKARRSLPVSQVTSYARPNSIPFMSAAKTIGEDVLYWVDRIKRFRR